MRVRIVDIKKTERETTFYYFPTPTTAAACTKKLPIHSHVSCFTCFHFNFYAQRGRKVFFWFTVHEIISRRLFIWVISIMMHFTIFSITLKRLRSRRSNCYCMREMMNHEWEFLRVHSTLTLLGEIWAIFVCRMSASKA